MKTDRELLELAAKAAGLTHIDYTNTGYDGRYGLVTTDCYGRHGPEFDPLNNDGDALRLAVKLDIPISSESVNGTTWVCRGELQIFQPHDGDPYAATRRAIVRAAAAIGEDVK